MNVVGRQKVVKFRHSTGVRDSGWLLAIGLLVFPYSATAEICQGLEATIVGTDGDEFIRGTDGPDVIAALGGDDIIEGGNGADIICGGAGDDLINGGPEQLTGSGSIRPIDAFQQSGDQIDGGEGTDSCDGDVGSDTATGCESTVNMGVDFRLLTLIAPDGTPLDGALFVPADDNRKVAMLASHGSLGRFSTAGLPGGSGPYGELFDLAVLTLNRRDNSRDNGGAFVTFEDAVADMKLGVDFLADLGFQQIFVAGHSKGTINAAAYLNLIEDERVAAVGLYSAARDSRLPADNPRIIAAQALVDQGLGDVPMDTGLRFGSNPWTPNGLLSFHGPDARTAAFLEVRRLQVPVLIMRAMGDLVTPDQSSREILDSALAAGVDATYTIIPFSGSSGAAHGFVGLMRQVMFESTEWLVSRVPAAVEMQAAPGVPPQSPSGNFPPPDQDQSGSVCSGRRGR